MLVVKRYFHQNVHVLLDKVEAVDSDEAWLVWFFCVDWE